MTQIETFTDSFESQTHPCGRDQHSKVLMCVALAQASLIRLSSKGRRRHVLLTEHFNEPPASRTAEQGAWDECRRIIRATCSGRKTCNLSHSQPIPIVQHDDMKPPAKAQQPLKPNRPNTRKRGQAVVSMQHSIQSMYIHRILNPPSSSTVTSFCLSTASRFPQRTAGPRLRQRPAGQHR